MAINLPLDMKLADSINRRRTAEESRKKRIFNPKLRQIGVDVEAINHQIHEHILSKNKQNEIEKHFANELRRQDQLAVLLDEKQNEKIQELNKKIDEFRLNKQRPEYRRDYDLYDPNLLKNELPPRISDAQDCPISGLQKFDGEDLNYKDRSKKQREQAKDLLLQQMHEKRLKNYMQNKRASDWESMLLNQDNNALQLAQAELDNCRKFFKELTDLNKYLAIEAAEKKMKQKMDDDYENRKDIEYNFYGDLLSENPLVARSALGPHRVVPDRWKGMTKQQLEEFHDGQVQQIIDKKRDIEHKYYETSKWHKQILTQGAITQLKMEEEKKQKAEAEKKRAMENLQLSQQQQIQKDYMNKIVYSNVPTENFFTQFNMSSR